MFATKQYFSQHYVALIFAIVQLAGCHGFSSPHHVVRSLQRRVIARSCDGFDNAHGNDARGDRHSAAPAATATTSLTMGLFDFIQETFLDSRDGDFVPLEQSGDEAFGPGPLILMYAVPESMDDEELMDMVEDGMPRRSKQEGGVVIRRISGILDEGEDNNGEELLDLTVGEALSKAMDSSYTGTIITTAPSLSTPAKPIVVASSSPENNNDPCPVLYFSGVSNTEMMDTYRIMANEIYEETNGVHWPACAKVVPPAMGKPMRQLLMEVSGDHADAMRIQREKAEKKKTE